MQEKAQIIADICSALSNGDAQEAAQIAQTEWQFIAGTPSKSRMTEIDRTRLFIRDGFIDRYSGEKLVFPGTLLLLCTIRASP